MIKRLEQTPNAQGELTQCWQMKDAAKTAEQDAKMVELLDALRLGFRFAKLHLNFIISSQGNCLNRVGETVFSPLQQVTIMV